MPCTHKPKCLDQQFPKSYSYFGTIVSACRGFPNGATVTQGFFNSDWGVALVLERVWRPCSLKWPQFMIRERFNHFKVITLKITAFIAIVYFDSAKWLARGTLGA